MRRWVVVLVLGACGDTKGKVPDAGQIDAQLVDAPSMTGPDAQVIADPPDGTDRSGTRLKRRVYVTADGFKDQFGWFDSLLGANCTFTTLSDASIRCIPAAAPELPVHFTNAMCTDRVLYASMPVTATYVTTLESCSRRVWKSLQPAAVTTVYIRNFQGVCVSLGSGGGYHYTATEATASEFVSATIALEGTNAELNARVRTTDDGGRELLHMYSPSLASPCMPDLLSDGVVRCAPRWFADSTEQSPPAFANAACTQSVRTFGQCVAVPTYKLFFVEPPSSCITAHDYAPITAYSGPLYNLINSQCQAATPATGLGYGAIGATLAPTAFTAEASRALGPTATRVRGYYSLYADGSAGPRALWDTVHATECEFKDAGAVSRCMPVDYLDLSGAYTDAACSEPLADSQGDTCAVGRRPDWARGAQGTYYRVIGDFAGTTVYAPSSNGCTAITPVPPSLLPLYTVGPPVTDWDVGTRMTEP